MTYKNKGPPQRSSGGYKQEFDAMRFPFRHLSVVEHSVAFLLHKHRIARNWILLLLVLFHDWSRLARYQK